MLIPALLLALSQHCKVDEEVLNHELNCPGLQGHQKLLKDVAAGHQPQCQGLHSGHVSSRREAVLGMEKKKKKIRHHFQSSGRALIATCHPLQLTTTTKVMEQHW